MLVVFRLIPGIFPASFSSGRTVSRSGFVTVPVPVETRVVVRVALASEQVTEHTSEVSNVGLGLELEGSAVGQVFGKLRRTSLAKSGDGDGLLLFHNELVLLGGRLGLESLPRQTSLEEVDQHVTDGFEIISAGLLDTQVIVDGSVTRSTGERSTLALGDVLEGSGVTVSLGQTEINAVDKVAVAAASVRDKVGGFDIAMDQVTGVHQLDALEHLIGYHENGFEGEASPALVELVLEGRTEKVHNHEVVRILGSKVVDLGEPGGILQLTVDLVLVTQLRTPGTVLFELHCDLFAIGTDSEVNVSKGSSADAFGDSVFRNRGLHGCT